MPSSAGRGKKDRYFILLVDRGAPPLNQPPSHYMFFSTVSWPWVLLQHPTCINMIFLITQIETYTDVSSGCSVNYHTDLGSPKVMNNSDILAQSKQYADKEKCEY